jgi:flagellar hook protein FlgE
MSLFGTLNTGASGLGVSSASMSVIGDNIANINTTGFKGMQASFANLMPNSIGGLNGSNQMGTGAAMAANQTLFGQGTVSGSDSALDLAISGKGFFQVSGEDGADYYTRDGGFYLNDEGYVVSSAGMKLQGYQAYGGDLTTRVADLQLDTGSIAGEMTEEVTLGITLGEVEQEDGAWNDSLTSAGLDGASETIEDLETDSDHSISLTIYDSLGRPQDVTVLMNQSGDNEWSYKIVVDASSIDASSYEEGYALEIGEGTLEFDDDGVLISDTQTFAPTDWFPGADATQEVYFDFGLDADGDEGNGSTKMQGTDHSNNTITQDGFGVGTLSSVEIDDDGQIIGSYSNGEEAVLGGVALATFASDAGLSRAGGNLFAATVDSGEAAMGMVGTGGRGSVSGYALEGSNVELEDQFVSMIQSQRSYQANARVISTANDTLQELVNLV